MPPLEPETIAMLLAAGRLLPLAAVCYWLLKPSPRQPAKQPPPGVDWRARSGLHATVKEKAPATGKSYLVIGTGSVGLIIMEALVERGEKKVKGLDVVAPRRGVEGATFAVGNVTDYSSIKAACEGVDVVYLTVALIRYYERLQYQYAASHAVNVTGTGNVLRACAECGVQVLVQTSTSNVCVAAALVSTSMDESSELVGPQNSPNHYGWTKAQAETMVLAANGAPLEPAARGALQTVAVRPCSGIFGLQDNFMTEKWLELGQVQISPSLPISPHISPYLPTSPRILGQSQQCVIRPGVVRKRLCDTLWGLSRFEGSQSAHLPPPPSPPSLGPPQTGSSSRATSSSSPPPPAFVRGGSGHLSNTRSPQRAGGGAPS